MIDQPKIEISNQPTLKYMYTHDAAYIHYDEKVHTDISKILYEVLLIDGYGIPYMTTRIKQMLPTQKMFIAGYLYYADDISSCEIVSNQRVLIVQNVSDYLYYVFDRLHAALVKSVKSNPNHADNHKRVKAINKLLDAMVFLQNWE